MILSKWVHFNGYIQKKQVKFFGIKSGSRPRYPTTKKTPTNGGFFTGWACRAIFELKI